MKKKSMSLKVFDYLIKNVNTWVSIAKLRNICKSSEGSRPRDLIIYRLRKEGINITNKQGFYMLTNKRK